MTKKRHLMYFDLQKATETPDLEASIITSADKEKLGELMYEAYQGTIDYGGETLDEAIQEISGTLDGKYGELISIPSLKIEQNGIAIAATIFVFFEKEQMPLLSFTMTHPQYKGKGLAQKLLKQGLRDLKNLGYKNCCLVVTEGNQPAQMIYEKLGFTYSG